MKLRILRWDHPTFCECTLNQMTSVFVSNREEKGHKEEGHVKTEAYTGVKCPQTREHLEPPDARRSKEEFSRDF